MDLRFIQPFTLCCYGSTGTGKTQWVRKLIKHHESMINKKIQRVVWFYGQHQPYYDVQDLPLPVEYVEGLDTAVLDSINSQVCNLVVIDDLASDLERDKKLSDLFTRGSHHKNMSVLFLCQNMFQKSSVLRTVSLNAHYMVIFKNPRDKSQITHMARQLQPTRSAYVVEAYIDATSRPYGYLLCDLTQSTPEEYRLRTNIFPDDPQPSIAYIPK